MFGIGLQELVILLVICGMIVAPIIGVLVVVFAVNRAQKNADSANLRRCNDCGGMVSVHAPSCPHCGKPFTGGHTQN